MAAQQTVGKPILQQPFQGDVAKAPLGLRELVAAELDDAINHQAQRASRR